MKIGILHYSCPPVIGGVEFIIEAHADVFLRYGHEVYVIAARGKKFNSQINFYKIPIIDSIYKKNLKINRKVLSEQKRTRDYLAYVGEIVEALTPIFKEIDVLICHNVLVKHLNFALIEAIYRLKTKYKRLRIINWMHDPFLVSYKLSELPDVSKFPWNLLLCNRNDIEHVTISESRKNEIIKKLRLSSSQIKVIPNGICPEKLAGFDKITTQIINYYQLLSYELIIFSPCRIVHKKNIERSIDIVHYLIEYGINAILVISGPLSRHLGNKGEAYFKTLKKKIENYKIPNNVVFLYEYPVSSKDYFIPSSKVIRDLYIISDLILLPSHEEGFGLPILEGAIFGKYIMVSDIPVLKEIGGDYVFYMELQNSPKKDARLIKKKVFGDKKLYFKKYIWNKYIWDNIYRYKLSPLLHKEKHRT